MEQEYVYCKAYDKFKELLTNGLTMEEAFYESVEELVEQNVTDSFEEGYVTAMVGLRELAQGAIEDIYSDKCDCESCTCDCE